MSEATNQTSAFNGTAQCSQSAFSTNNPASQSAVTAAGEGVASSLRWSTVTTTSPSLSPKTNIPVLFRMFNVWYECWFNDLTTIESNTIQPHTSPLQHTVLPSPSPTLLPLPHNPRWWTHFCHTHARSSRLPQLYQHQPATTWCGLIQHLVARCPTDCTRRPEIISRTSTVMETLYILTPQATTVSQHSRGESTPTLCSLDSSQDCKTLTVTPSKSTDPPYDPVTKSKLLCPQYPLLP